MNEYPPQMIEALRWLEDADPRLRGEKWGWIEKARNEELVVGHRLSPTGWELISGPLLVTLEDIERITRVAKKTLRNGKRPTPQGHRGTAKLYRYSDWVSIWPKNRDPLPNENAARRIVAEVSSSGAP